VSAPACRSIARALVCLVWAASVLGMSQSAAAQELPPGVTASEFWFYSEGVACHGRMFYPPGYSETASLPAVVLANGWAGTARASERYAAGFAERGLVAMTFDYRGWGRSGGFATLAEPIKTDDRLRLQQTVARVRLNRHRLIPNAQVDDIKAAIAYLQGEPGVDRDRIGLWGTNYAGGYLVSVAALDPRVKAGVALAPLIAGHGQSLMPVEHAPAVRTDMVRRARTGKGATRETGVSGLPTSTEDPIDAPASGPATGEAAAAVVEEPTFTIDLETDRLVAEYRPFQSLGDVPETFPILFILAADDELINNATNAYAAADMLRGPTHVLEEPGVTHFDIHQGEPFERAVAAAADWFLLYLR
jgi:dienelactone hydrolase